MTPARFAEAIVCVGHWLGGDFQYELGEEQIILICRRCPFDDAIKKASTGCRLVNRNVAASAASHFGYGKVILKKTLARGDDHCDIRVHLKKTAEAETEEGTEYHATEFPLDRHGGSGPFGVENADQLKARIRFLENRVEELERTLEDRKLIEKAKGILMKRLKLTEAEAMRKLQKESQQRNKKLAEIARVILEAGRIL